jgi:hypothetical protein
MRRLVFSTLFCFFISVLLLKADKSAWAQLPCNHFIGPEVTIADGNGNYSSVQPGDTVCITPRTDPKKARGWLSLRNFQGRPGNTIVFINHGGQVKIDGNLSWIAVEMKNCQYFRFTGTGVNNLEYGFKIFHSSNKSIFPHEGSEYFEIDHLEVMDGTIGVGKADKGITLYDFKYHHIYAHDIETECFYIGSSHYPEESLIDGVRIYNNTIENCGWEGIQVGSATRNVAVHHNYIKNIGSSTSDYVGNGRCGIMVNKGTAGDYYNNFIINAARWGIFMHGLGNHKVYNNLIVNTGHYGDDDNTNKKRGIGIRASSGNSSFYNNTIVNSKQYGIKATSSNNLVYDNIIVGSEIKNIDLDADKNSIYNNITINPADVGFVDRDNNDFHLTANSSAVNAGSNSGFAPFDYDNIDRPQPPGGQSDIGAYEYSQTTFPSPPPPHIACTFPQLLSGWLNSTSSCDLNGDRKTNGMDFGELLRR